MDYQFDEKIERAIEKSARSAQRFYREQRKAALERGEEQGPPSLEAFLETANRLIEANKQVELRRAKNPRIQELLERTWSQKLLNYSTQKLLRDAYEALLRRF